MVHICLLTVYRPIHMQSVYTEVNFVCVRPITFCIQYKHTHTHIHKHTYTHSTPYARALVI